MLHGISVVLEGARLLLQGYLDSMYSGGCGGGVQRGCGSGFRHGPIRISDIHTGRVGGGIAAYIGVGIAGVAGNGISIGVAIIGRGNTGGGMLTSAAAASSISAPVSQIQASASRSPRVRHLTPARPRPP